jgi:small-conductance mechanosensitive channel
VFLTLRLGGAAERRLEARAAARAPAQGGRFELVPGHRLWRLGADVTRFAKRVSIALFLYLLLGYVFVQFPWTRGAGERLGEWVVAPLRQLARAFLAWLPDLLFLVVLALVARFALRLIRQFFDAVGRGDLDFHGFEPDWAAPTYKLVRAAVIAFALIMAYPYVPGSSTEAFKGISIFFGVLLSLGASSMVGNLVAGYAMTYRRAFREGDVIRVDDSFGRVTATRLIVTHLRTPKNEEIVIPNSKILGADVVNYSTLAKSHGLILHTQVGIGYETPWRLVESMLIEAAQRVPDLLREPKPFVWQKSLGDFAITYEINAATDRPTEMPRLYTELHRAILDVFNENEIQIMTPAYEGDPEIPKIVAPAQNNPSLAGGPAPKPTGGASS